MRLSSGPGNFPEWMAGIKAPRRDPDEPGTTVPIVPPQEYTGSALSGRRGRSRIIYPVQMNSIYRR